MFQESNRRSLVKTLVWRFVVLILDFSLAYFLFKDFELATGFAVVKLVVATLVYYLHERLWNKISWGKKS